MRKYSIMLLSLILMLISCTRIEDESVLNIAISSEPPTLDVMVNTSLSSRIVAVGNIYEKLFVLDKDDNIALELAEEYNLSSDRNELTIKIRDGVLFHDGQEMTADDVVESLNRWLDKYSTANTLVNGARFEKIDKYTLRIKSTTTLVFLPYLISSAPQSAVITEKRIIDSQNRGELINEYIGTGPYRLSKWKSGDYIELERFEEYKPYSSISNGIWGKKEANIDKLIYQIVPDSVTRRLGLQSGQFDFINDVMSEDRSFFDKDENIYMLEGGESGSIALVFNKREGVCTNIDFRKAISLALDYDSLMKACYGEYGYSIHSDYMEKEQSLWSVEDTNEYKGKDINRAKEYLEKSGYTGERVRILTSNLSNLDKIAVAISSDLDKLGIESEIIKADWTSMIEMRKNPSCWDIYISAFSRVPLPQMKSYLSDTFPGWFDNNEKSFTLLSKMNDVKNIEEASLLWKEAQKSLWEYVPVIIPGHYTTVYGARKNIKGIINQDGFFFWNARKEIK